MTDTTLEAVARAIHEIAWPYYVWREDSNNTAKAVAWATAAIAAYEAAQWQPIETAPTDGTPILAYEPGEVPCVVQALRYQGHLIWQACCYDMAGLNKPTHWRPLPPPPA